MVGTETSVVATPNTCGVVASDGVGAFTGKKDVSIFTLGNAGDQAVSGTYGNITASNGRGTATAVLGSTDFVFYILGPNKFLLISVDPGSANPALVDLFWR